MRAIIYGNTSVFWSLVFSGVYFGPGVSGRATSIEEEAIFYAAASLLGPFLAYTFWRTSRALRDLMGEPTSFEGRVRPKPPTPSGTSWLSGGEVYLKSFAAVGMRPLTLGSGIIVKKDGFIAAKATHDILAPGDQVRGNALSQNAPHRHSHQGMSMGDGGEKTYALTCHEGAKRIDSFLAQNLKTSPALACRDSSETAWYPSNAGWRRKRATPSHAERGVVVRLPPPVPLPHRGRRDCARCSGTKTRTCSWSTSRPAWWFTRRRPAQGNPGRGSLCITAEGSFGHRRGGRGPASFTGSTRIRRPTDCGENGPGAQETLRRLKARRIHRHYLAIVRGIPAQGKGR